MDYLLELKKKIEDKDIEIKDFQRRTKLLLQQVKEKNAHIKHLEKILNNQNKYNKPSNRITFLNSNKDFIINTNETDNNYKIISDLNAKSNEKYKKLYIAYEKLKKDYNTLKEENMILYGSSDSMIKEKNGVYKLFQQKEKEFSELVLEKNSLEKEIENLKEINNKLKTENMLYINENKNKIASKENTNDIKNEINDNEEKNNFQKKNEILEMEKKTLEKKIEELQLELNKIKKNDKNNLKPNEEEITKKINENLIKELKELNEKINKQKEEIEELGNYSRDSELKYLNKIENLQNSINEIKRNYLFLEKKNEIQFSFLNTKEKK